MTEARKKIKFLWNNYHIHAFLKIRAPSGFISFGVFTTDASCCKRSCELLPHYLTCLAWPEIAQKVFQVFVANYCHFQPHCKQSTNPFAATRWAQSELFFHLLLEKKKPNPSFLQGSITYLILNLWLLFQNHP